MRALVIGRFQPVHYGHLGMMHELDKMGLEEIILCIGIPQDGITQRNPFTYDQVREMWEPELEKLKTNVTVYPVTDINDAANYAKYIEGITGCNSKDTLVVTGNDYTAKCFTEFGYKYAVYRQRANIALDDGYLCATKVRDWINNGGPWEKYVPESTRNVVNEMYEMVI